MCLGVPGTVVDVHDDPFGVRMGRVRFGGVVKDVCLAYTPDVRPGEYVVVHVGFAIARVDEEEAARMLRLLDDPGEGDPGRDSGFAGDADGTGRPSSTGGG